MTTTMCGKTLEDESSKLPLDGFSSFHYTYLFLNFLWGACPTFSTGRKTVQLCACESSRLRRHHLRSEGRSRSSLSGAAHSLSSPAPSSRSSRIQVHVAVVVVDVDRQLEGKGHRWKLRIRSSKQLSFCHHWRSARLLRAQDMCFLEGITQKQAGSISLRKMEKNTQETFCFFWAHHSASVTSLPWPGSWTSGPWQSPNHWTMRILRDILK